MDCKLCHAHIEGRQWLNITITINNEKKTIPSTEVCDKIIVAEISSKIVRPL